MLHLSHVDFPNNGFLMKPKKATREQLKRHNRQLLLRAVYYDLADNRAALAQMTGLAKPTVSDLIAELIEEGLLEEGGLGESTEIGGKRPTLIKFVPDARHVIGISLDTSRAYGVLSNLAGQIVARHYADMDSMRGDEALVLLTEVINGLIAQLDAPLLCIGVGVPGVVDNEAGIVRQSEHLGWHDLPLVEILADHYDVPIYIGNNSELTAIAQFAFGTDGDDATQNLVTIFVANSVEIGAAWRGAAYHHGGDIGSLQVIGNRRLDTLLGWGYVQARYDELRRDFPNTMLPEDDITYMHIRYGAANGDLLALALVDELASYLAQVIAWVIGLLRPDHISLAGAMVNLGESFLEEVSRRAGTLLSPPLVQVVAFSLAYSPNMNAIGAAAHAIQKELDLI
jgi:predicted NBD/HSP70 family sugar kinase